MTSPSQLLPAASPISTVYPVSWIPGCWYTCVELSIWVTFCARSEKTVVVVDEVPHLNVMVAEYPVGKSRATSTKRVLVSPTGLHSMKGIGAPEKLKMMRIVFLVYTCSSHPNGPNTPIVHCPSASRGRRDATIRSDKA